MVNTICVILDELRPLNRSVRGSGPRDEESEKLQSDHEPQTFCRDGNVDEATQSYKSLITLFADRSSPDQRYAIDASKIQRELGWKPAETFEIDLRNTVEWYLNNSE